MTASIFRKAVLAFVLSAATVSAQWPWVWTRDTNVYAFGSTTNGKPLSVKGVPGLAPSTNVVDIEATGPLTYLRENAAGTSLEWGTLPPGLTLPILNSGLADMPALTVKVNPTPIIGDPQDMQASGTHKFLRTDAFGSSLVWDRLRCGGLQNLAGAGNMENVLGPFDFFMQVQFCWNSTASGSLEGWNLYIAGGDAPGFAAISANPPVAPAVIVAQQQFRGVSFSQANTISMLIPPNHYWRFYKNSGSPTVLNDIYYYWPIE